MFRKTVAIAFFFSLFLWGPAVLGSGFTETKLLPSDGDRHDRFGYRSFLDGDVAVVASFLDDDNGSDSGSAYVFRYDPVAFDWIEEAKLLPSDGDSYDEFGLNVFIDGDVIVGGAHYDDDNGSNSGSAYVFRYDTVTETWIEEAKLLASDGASGDDFGRFCAVRDDLIIIGARLDSDNGTDSGSAYIYRYDEGSQAWIEEAKLLPADGSAGDAFGSSVDIEGEVALIGARWNDDNGGDSGSAYIFRYDSSTQTWSEEVKLLPANGSSGDEFGGWVSISGNAVLIGARHRTGSRGAAYVFRYDEVGSTWKEEATLLASDGEAGDYFGTAVVLDGDVALVGSAKDDDNGSSSGSAYLFHFNPAEETWSEHAKVLPSDGASNDHFGISVGLSGEFVLVGSFYDDVQGSNSGSAYIFLENIIYVPDDFATIQEAIDSASGGEIVLVRPGTYVENIDFNGKPITIQGEKGADLTTIDGNQSGSVVVFQNAEGASSILNGFTITNGSAAMGGGILCDGASPLFAMNRIVANAADSGAGICCQNAASPVIVNSIITENTAGNDGGGVYCNASSPTITNTTLFGNTAVDFGGGLCCIDASPVVTNTILWGDSAATGPEIHANSGSSPVVTYCDIQGGWTGTGNIDDDPLFFDSANHDFHLTLLSPCLDRGDNFAPSIPGVDFEGDPRISGYLVDMGMDEFHIHLYYSGDPIPGGVINIKVVGRPWEQVELALGFDLQNSPIETQHGHLYIWPIFWRTNIGTMPIEGIIAYSGTIPSHWIPGDFKAFQALVGAWGDTGTELTNLLVLEVE